MYNMNRHQASKNFVKLLNKNGILIIEDVHTKEIADDLMKSLPNEMKGTIRMVEGTKVQTRVDDRLVIYKNK